MEGTAVGPQIKDSQYINGKMTKELTCPRLGLILYNFQISRSILKGYKLGNNSCEMLRRGGKGNRVE